MIEKMKKSMNRMLMTISNGFGRYVFNIITLAVLAWCGFVLVSAERALVDLKKQVIKMEQASKEIEESLRPLR